MNNKYYRNKEYNNMLQALLVSVQKICILWNTTQYNYEVITNAILQDLNELKNLVKRRTERHLKDLQTH